MGKIKYLFKRIIKMDYKNMFRIAKAISKKTKKKQIYSNYNGSYICKSFIRKNGYYAIYC